MTETNAQHIIDIDKVSKTFHTQNGQVQALDECSLHVERGEIRGIIGYSGAGKSTLLRLINRLEEPDCGRVRVSGRDLAELPKRELLAMRRRIGMIFQHFNLLHSASVFENILAPLSNMGLSRHEASEKIYHLLELVDLSDKIDAYPQQLSGGQKQRVAIARALSGDPEILLCDEATSALDPNTTQSILGLIGRISRELRLTVVIITHQMEVIKSICDRVAVMEQGRIVEDDDIISIFTRPQAQITREFVAQGDRSSSFDGLEDWPRPLYRLSFLGSMSEEPFIARMMRDFAVTPNILRGNIQHLSDTPFGSLVLDIEGEERAVQCALGYLQHQGIAVEVLQS